jgi:GT2 family glycosyltransferase
MYNCADDLAQLLGALEAQDLASDRFEILLVDNGSADDTLLQSRQWSERTHLSASVVSEHERLGSYAARNKGIALAQGAILAFTDADCIPAPDWLQQGTEALASNGERVIIGGKTQLFLPDGRSMQDANAVEAYEMLFAFNSNISLFSKPAFQTSNLLLWRSAIDAIGTFDPDLRSGGDFDWCWRAQRSGYSCIFVPECLVRHPARSSVRALLRKARRVAGGDYALQKKGRAKPRKAAGSRLRTYVEAVKLALTDRRIPTLHGRIAVLRIALIVKSVKSLQRLHLRVFNDQGARR